MTDNKIISLKLLILNDLLNKGVINMEIYKSAAQKIAQEESIKKAA